MRELMLILGFFTLARSEFGAVSGTTSRLCNAAAAASMGIFCDDGVTGNRMGLCFKFAGMYHLAHP